MNKKKQKCIKKVMKTNINMFFLEEDADSDFAPFNREKHTTTLLISIHFQRYQLGSKIVQPARVTTSWHGH